MPQHSAKVGRPSGTLQMILKVRQELQEASFQYHMSKLGQEFTHFSGFPLIHGFLKPAIGCGYRDGWPWSPCEVCSTSSCDSEAL
eukprot:6227410-Amphidinium_carterae.1